MRSRSCASWPAASGPPGSTTAWPPRCASWRRGRRCGPRSRRPTSASRTASRRRPTSSPARRSRTPSSTPRATRDHVERRHGATAASSSAVRDDGIGGAARVRRLGPRRHGRPRRGAGRARCASTARPARGPSSPRSCRAGRDRRGPGAAARRASRACSRTRGHEVVGGASTTPTGLRAAVSEHEPDLAVVDVRMPPTFTDEGIRAARWIRDAHPRRRRARPLPARRVRGRRRRWSSQGGFGYLLKDRVLDVGRVPRRRRARRATAARRSTRRSSRRSSAREARRARRC